MELPELITELHKIKQLQQELSARLKEYKEQQAQLEQQIKSILDQDKIEYDNLSEEEFQMLLSDLHNPQLINVEVVYADNDNQIIRAVQASPGVTIEDCIAMSDILDSCSHIDLTKNKVGIYGMVKPLSATVQDGDRIEVYRPVEQHKS
ncbi:MAG: RnfH family protein [Gammaproteobacteria bacterium]|jgi:putative ubiquitin-RnfH superfamily antitoxin RatB of RatAB toxin-antitoxin module